MKPRLLACATVTLLVIGAAALVPRGVLAQGPQGGRSSNDHQSKQDGSRQGGQLSAQIDKALQAYDERMDKNLDQCRKEMDQMKKELHELIDLRLNMAMSLAELRANPQPQGAGFASRGGSPGTIGDEGHGHAAGMSRELQQLHNQLRSEIDHQQSQIAQLAAQLRGMQHQDQQPQHHPGHGQSPSQGHRPGQGSGEGRQGQPGPQAQQNQPGQANQSGRR